IQLQILHRVLDRREYVLFSVRIIPEFGCNPEFLPLYLSSLDQISYGLSYFCLIAVIECTINVPVADPDGLLYSSVDFSFGRFPGSESDQVHFVAVIKCESLHEIVVFIRYNIMSGIDNQLSLQAIV